MNIFNFFKVEHLSTDQDLSIPAIKNYKISISTRNFLYFVTTCTSYSQPNV